MFTKVVLISVVIFTVILETKSDSNGSNCETCRYKMSDNTRVKRAKYYGPQKFYRRPPMNYPTKGAFSYTPPPGYMKDDDDQYPAHFKPKVSKRPVNDGLGSEDINNLVKYLSKKDLDKIIEFAGEKGKYRESSRDEYEKEYGPSHKTPDIKVQDDDGKKFSINGPYIQDEKPRPDYVNPNNRAEPIVYQEHPSNENPNINEATQPGVFHSNPPDNPPLINQRPIVSHQNYQSNENSKIIDYINEAKQPKTIYSNPQNVPPLQTQEPTLFYNQNTQGSIYTDSTIMQEEPLPKPLNLREDDYEVSFSNNVAKVVKSESSSYEVENFGELPLMNYYDSKLHSVSSYKVPHYTVTSPKHPPPPPSSSSSLSSQVPLEPAPPGATGHDQSDAHLKAIKIWTHKSTGTAYTLHDDGTLTLEKPRYGRP